MEEGMNRSQRIVVVLFALLAIGPFVPDAQAACSYQSVPNPPVVAPLLYNPQFSQSNCSAWSYSGDASLDSYGVVIGSDGSFEQTFTVPSSNLFDSVAIEVEVLTSGAALDRLYVEFLATNGTHLDTITFFNRSTAHDTYYFNPDNNYNGQTIKIKFSSSHGVLGGTTVWRVRQAHLWIFN
jgi:hypothetical protein